MWTWNVFFQNIFQMIRKIRGHKTALLCAGILLAAAVPVFGESAGKSGGSLTAFAETPAGTMAEPGRQAEKANENTAEKAQEDTPEAQRRPGKTDGNEAEKTQKDAAETILPGQRLVGGLLVQKVKAEEQEREEYCREMAQARRKAFREKRMSSQAEQAQKEVFGENGEKIAERVALEQMDETQKTQAKSKTAASAVSYTESDYQVLLKIVEAEAGICDEKGKILVANVVLNRVRSKKFPNTITEVVYQRKQFSPVANGKIDTCTVTKETIDCVNRALGGEDYSQGALYFMYRQGSSAGAASWFDRDLTFLFSHGRHEFFK